MSRLLYMSCTVSFLCAFFFSCVIYFACFFLWVWVGGVRTRHVLKFTHRVLHNTCILHSYRVALNVLSCEQVYEQHVPVVCSRIAHCNRNPSRLSNKFLDQLTANASSMVFHIGAGHRIASVAYQILLHMKAIQYSPNDSRVHSQTHN